MNCLFQKTDYLYKCGLNARCLIKRLESRCCVMFGQWVTGRIVELPEVSKDQIK